MKGDKRFQLLYGPYQPPEIPPDHTLFCEMRGYLPVGRWSDASIPWPKRWRANSLILCGDLVRAVRQESVDAVSYHWGVCRGVVQTWRKALGVPENTPGTSHYRKWSMAHGAARRQKRYLARAEDPNARVKAPRLEHERGHPLLSPALSELLKKRMARDGHPDPELKLWTSEEDKLLGTAPDLELAKMLGRSVAAVAYRRNTLGIRAPNYHYLRPWTSEEESLLGSMPDAELAARLGRTIEAVYERRIGLLPETKERAAPKRRAGGRFGKWDPAELALLGAASDEEIAEAVGRTKGAVRAMRHDLGIANFVRHGSEWSQAEIALLGTLPDAEAAKRLQRSIQSVATKRCLLGIPNARPVAAGWKPEEDALLGTRPDTEIAKLLGRTRRAVMKRRIRLGLTNKFSMVVRWSLEDEKLLGTMPDVELASKLGRAPQAVLQRRVRLKISVFNSTFRLWTSEEESLLGKFSDKEMAGRIERPVSAVRGRRQEKHLPLPNANRRVWSEADMALLGKVPDRELARQIGCTSGGVAYQRRHRGIEYSATV